MQGYISMKQEQKYFVLSETENTFVLQQIAVQIQSKID